MQHRGILAATPRGIGLSYVVSCLMALPVAVTCGPIFASDKIFCIAGEDGPACYCHGERHEAAYEVTQANAAGSGCEYAYVLHAGAEGQPLMTIYSSYCSSSYEFPSQGSASGRKGGGSKKMIGRKMIGCFGKGDASASWQVVAAVDLCGAPPDWDQLDRLGSAG